MMNLRTLGLAVVVTLFASNVVACAKTPAKQAVAPDRASELTIAIRAHDYKINRALSDALVRAGYRVIDDASEGRGRPSTSDVRLDVSLSANGGGSVQTLGPDGAVLDSIELELDTSAIEPSDFNGFVSQLGSTRAVRLGIQARAAHEVALQAAAARAAAEAREKAEAARIADEQAAQARLAAETDAWAGANAASCASPARASDCDALVKFVGQFPEGARNADARALLASTAPRIVELRDDEAWALVDVTACRKPRTEDSCASAWQYINLFGDAGRHATEARKAVAEGDTLIERLRAARENRERAQAAAAAANEAAEAASSSSGSGSWSGGGSSRASHGGGGSVNVRSYTRSNGTVVRSHTRRK